MATIKKLENGKKWELRYDTIDPMTGRRVQHRKRFPRQSDAKEHLKRIEEFGKVFSEDMPLRDGMRKWLEKKRPGLRPTTYRGYSVNIENHIIPALGNVMMSLLNPLIIDDFYTDLAEAGLAYNTIKYIHRVLSGALKYYAKLRVIQYNPCLYVELPEVEQNFEPVILNAQQTKKLLEVLQNNEIYIPTLLALTMGWRRGECLGLRWEDVHFRTQKIHLHNNRTHADGIVENALKAKRQADLLMCPPLLMNALRRHRKQQMILQAELPDAYIDSGYVCTWNDGTPYNPNSFSKVFARALNAAGVRHMRFQDLRHTHVSLLRNEGIDKELVMQRVGHNTEQMTEHYTHLSDDQQKVVVDTITRLLT